MQHFIGLDVHFQSTTMVVINNLGEEVLRKVLPTREYELRMQIGSIAGPKALTFEEGTMAKWLFGILHGSADKILVCDPKYVTKKTLSKTDYIDALHLANELRAGNLIHVYHDHNNPFLDLRLLVSAYRSLVVQHVQTQNRFRTLFRSEGLELPRGEKCFSNYDITLSLKSASRREIAMRLLEQYMDLEIAKKKYVENFKKLSHLLPEIDRLRQLPGIDYVRAVTLAACVGEANRFPSKHHYWSYCGLVNHMQISGGNNYGFKKSRGRSELKELYLGAVENCLLSKKNPFRVLYDKLRSKGLDHRSAKKATARKMASITLKMLKTGKNYDEKLVI